VTESAAPAVPGPERDEEAGEGSRETRRESRRTERRRKSAVLFLRDVLVILVVAVLVSFLIKTFLIRSFYIPSASMESTLEINDRIIVNQLEPSVFPLDHGDVVVFRDPGGWLPPSAPVQQPPLVAALDWALSVVGLSAPDSNDHLIKRVIGLPGDHVSCCNALGQMSVNGVPLNEPYVKLPAGITKVSDIDFDVTVPKGYLWVMGDNRYNSRDSRYNTDKPGKGFVPVGNVVGRAFVVSWPLGRWGWLDDFPQTFQGVDKGSG
jgi:signal peptidase I